MVCARPSRDTSSTSPRAARCRRRHTTTTRSTPRCRSPPRHARAYIEQMTATTCSPPNVITGADSAPLVQLGARGIACDCAASRGEQGPARDHGTARCRMDGIRSCTTHVSSIARHEQRAEPLGFDKKNCAYWQLGSFVYREHMPTNKRGAMVWEEVRATSKLAVIADAELTARVAAIRDHHTDWIDARSVASTDSKLRRHQEPQREAAGCAVDNARRGGRAAATPARAQRPTHAAARPQREQHHQCRRSSTPSAQGPRLQVR